MSTEFQWNDETVLEFVQFTLKNSSLLQSRYADIKQFKLSKQHKKVIITTEDGVDYYENEKKDIYGVHTRGGYNSVGAWKSNVHKQFYPVLKEHYELFFSTKEIANEYILNNKPLLTLNEIRKVGNCEDNNIYYRRLVDIAKSKLK